MASTSLSLSSIRRCRPWLAVSLGAALAGCAGVGISVPVVPGVGVGVSVGPSGNVGVGVGVGTSIGGATIGGSVRLPAASESPQQ